MSDFRTEKDFLGELSIPQACYWVIHTQRAVNNFHISSLKINPSLIGALAQVKKACAQANAQNGYLSCEKTAIIEKVCDEISARKRSVQFPAEAYQYHE